jgi:transcriptional regulator with XRE-family HTH domain
MELNYTLIGERVRIERIEKGLTQQQLAEKAGLTSTHISHIENANTKVSLPSIIQVANALPVSIATLLCDNLIESRVEFEKDIADILKDCNKLELRMIAEVARSLKSAIRQKQLSDIE